MRAVQQSSSSSMVATEVPEAAGPPQRTPEEQAAWEERQRKLKPGQRYYPRVEMPTPEQIMQGVSQRGHGQQAPWSPAGCTSPAVLETLAAVACLLLPGAVSLLLRSGPRLFLWLRPSLLPRSFPA